MATTAANGNLTSLTASTASSRPATSGAVSRRRVVSARAGRAIEMLGHAIEYLADEFSLECLSQPTREAGDIPPMLEAIELLKARNREVYFSCPEALTLGERLRSWLHPQRA